MKKAKNLICALAIAAGLVIGAAGSGLLALLGGIALAYAGTVTLISKNTDWIWKP